MKNNTLFLACVIILCFTQCKPEPKEELKEMSFPVSVGENPESITKGFDGDYFITLMNGNEPEDAEVVRLKQDGSVSSFFKGGNQPKGIVYLKDHIYFSDVTRVWKVNSKGEGEVFVDADAFPFEVVNLNDVAVDEDKNGIYITDMGDASNMFDGDGFFWPIDSEEAKNNPRLGRVYHIDLNGTVRVIKDTSDQWVNPNGVGVGNQGNLMVGAFFNGYFLVENEEGELVALNGSYRGADAVEQDSKGNYYVSSWNQGKVWKIDGKSQESTLLIDGLESAADFYLEEEHNRLLLPDMKTGLLHSVALDKE